MILLDTHIWIWLVNESENISQEHHQIIEQQRVDDLGVSVISSWEVAKLVELGRIDLNASVDGWITQALSFPNIQLFDLRPIQNNKYTRRRRSLTPDPWGKRRIRECSLRGLRMFIFLQ